MLNMDETRIGLWERVETIVRTLSKITGLLGAIFLLAAAVVTTEGVMVRKVLNWSTTWQIELSVFLLMYACFVGAAYAQMGERHLNIDLLIIYLPPRIREYLLLITGIMSCVVCAVVAWYAWPMWWDAVLQNEHSESLWGPPMWVPYFFLPLGMTLLLLQSVVQLRRRIINLSLGGYETVAKRSELKGIDVRTHSNPDMGGQSHG